MRSIVGILLVTALGFAACGGGAIEVISGDATKSEPATVRGESRQWDRVIAQDSGSVLTVEFVGGAKGPFTEPCTSNYETDVEETVEQIVITVYQRQLVEPLETDSGCPAIGHYRRIEVAIAAPLGERTVIDGHDESVHLPISESELPPTQSSITTPPDVFDTTTTSGAAVELDAEGRLLQWVGSVRLEPWFDGFRFEQTNDGRVGVIALNLDADPPELPADLPLRSVVSRMGQQEWRDLVPTLTDEMETMGVVGLSYDPFEDTLMVSHRKDLPAGADQTNVAENVTALLGDRFNDITVVFDIGTGTDFQSPSTTR